MKNKIKKNTMVRKFQRRFSILFFLLFCVIIVLFFLIYVALFWMKIPIQYIKNPVVGTVIIFAICSFLAYLTARIVIRNMLKTWSDLNYAIHQISEGNYEVQVRDPKVTIPEIHTMIANFNYMTVELKSAQQFSNDFVSNVSHEFKTPLSVVDGYVSLLKEQKSTPSEQAEYLDKIAWNVEKLNSLTDNILRLSRLENARSLEPPVSYRLDEQIREAFVLMELKWSAKQIEPNLDGLCEANYKGQRDLLFQVWLNLLSNAVKFSNMGGKISVSIKETEQYFVVYFSDEGIGMTEETSAHIFEKFYQGDSSRQSMGNGLGLTLCKEILDRCGGEIQVKSQYGVGSVFIVRLDKKKYA